MGLFEILIYWWLPLLAGSVMVMGLVYRLWSWSRPPVTLPIPLTPARRSSWVHLPRLLGRLGFMANLRFSGAGYWFGVLALHLGLVAVFCHHLGLALDPAPAWAVAARWAAAWSAYLVLAALFFLFLRRCVSPPVVYLSSPADYLLLILLSGTVLSGLGLRLVARVDMVAFKTYLAGLWFLDYSAPPPRGWLLFVHLFFGGSTLVLFPFTRLSHGLMLFFNPVLRRAARIRGRPMANRWPPDAGERDAWALEHAAQAYRERLHARWAAQGKDRVMGAGERAASRSPSPVRPEEEVQ